MLKKDSLVGKTIITNKSFSINVLSAEQEYLARYYSNVRSPDSIKEDKWDILNDQFAHIKNARIVLDCEYHDIFDEYPANIYVARVVDSSVNKVLLPLIYESRNFINLNK
jgi:flavin reductase (DIM6/NTAB) family NADH-FMN oxidoreductase RutF